jgi:hypothetical protein
MGFQQIYGLLTSVLSSGNPEQEVNTTQGLIPEWELIAFVFLESFIFLLTLQLLYLVMVYICRFGRKEADPYIVASFIILGLAVSDRCITNFNNYRYAFDYLRITSSLSEE